MENFENLSWLELIILILASYRLTHLIVFDKITEFLRKPFMKKKRIETAHGSEVKNVPKNMFGYLLNCYWCAGIWSAIFFGGAYLLFPDFALIIAFVFAIAGGQSIIETFVGVNIKKVAYYSALEHANKDVPASPPKENPKG
ncbi:hypothetical protein AM500_23510 [Bacillus sp. FJAT-18017]|uniref:DUF1360 domain-containing protein n=1 Tax=Bacillus sp. FJAT-18017 TaxID=1705566 RepID=UPI0006B0162D|nr:DUF1360 domain-containing protein [Bacillus sp. FJAT-18017]ALC92400.1 hypothetical protein AM500_23510 [Bacillus sp. FJAT-18017]